MNQVLDFRSDTVTKPNEAMREAIARAEVGDDVFGDDPTVNALERRAADLLGKEAAVFVASGTMANLLSVMSATRPGDEILLGDECHIFNYEVAGTARIANVQAHALHNGPDGTLDPGEVEAAIRGPNIHAPENSLLCIENTHNRCGGAVLGLETMDALTVLAHRHGMRVHLDGARIFNAQAALGVPAARIAQDCDSVSFCLSKGLACPVGSLVCGDSAFVETARRNRKMLGGGMRQVGILAAAGLYALDHNIDRLPEDHANARRLADGLRSIEVFDLNEPASNIVVVDLRRGELGPMLGAMREAGVLAVPFGARKFRMVTHLDVSPNDVDEALNRIESVVGALAV